jgi:hypothetical protein
MVGCDKIKYIYNYSFILLFFYASSAKENIDCPNSHPFV